MATRTFVIANQYLNIDSWHSLSMEPYLGVYMHYFYLELLVVKFKSKVHVINIVPQDCRYLKLTILTHLLLGSDHK